MKSEAGPNGGNYFMLLTGAWKITLNVPEELLEAAQRTSGQGVTETVRQGLRLVAAGETFRRVAKLRGTVKFSVNLKKLRDDR